MASFKEFFVISVLVVFVSLTGTVFAGTEHNVSGFAWSENIGWVSFNSISDGSSINYGVHISTSTGKFSGYAWSENIGWISFQESDLAGCPLPPCYAYVDNVSNLGKENVKVKGWARVLAAGGGWDGWIRFDHGQTGEVYIDQNGDFHGWAWSDMVLGWLSFNSTDPGAGGASYKVRVTISLPPPPPPPPPPPSEENYTLFIQSSPVTTTVTVYNKTQNQKYSTTTPHSTILPSGTSLEISASKFARGGFMFVKWKGEGSCPSLGPGAGTTTISFILNSNSTCTAVYLPLPFWREASPGTFFFDLFEKIKAALIKFFKF